MSIELTRDDLAFILECLGHTRSAYEATKYPDYATKQNQLDRLSSLEAKLRELRDIQQAP